MIGDRGEIAHPCLHHFKSAKLGHKERNDMSNSLVLPAPQVEQIERTLDELQAKTNSNFVFLADVSGQLLCVRGRLGKTDVLAFSALTASNMAATKEMARMMGQADGFRLLFHEGQRENIYLAQVGKSFLLAVVFSVDVQIGLVRLFSKRALEELSALANEFESAVNSVPSIMEAGFSAALEQELTNTWRG